KLAGVRYAPPEPENPIKRVFKALFGGERR
ncbi:MAG: hypothetical protein PWQ32_1208, partial [Thermococcaceae archaeon]|nr:hypothetical protein [Thermococcaceae archaeon]